MSREIKFTVMGPPQGKGRPRFSQVNGRTITRTPDATVLYENLIRTEYERQCEGVMFEAGVPVEMRITAYYGIPKSVSKKKRAQMLDGSIRPTKKPDSSNVEKAVEDACNGVAYHDDAQIVESRISRFYGEIPRLEIVIREVGQ